MRTAIAVLLMLLAVPVGAQGLLNAGDPLRGQWQARWDEAGWLPVWRTDSEIHFVVPDSLEVGGEVRRIWEVTQHFPPIGEQHSILLSRILVRYDCKLRQRGVLQEHRFTTKSGDDTSEVLSRARSHWPSLPVPEWMFGTAEAVSVVCSLRAPTP
jgi:hypothetical protein